MPSLTNTAAAAAPTVQEIKAAKTASITSKSASVPIQVQKPPMMGEAPVWCI
ncbi:hypothetical protein HDU80_008494 [Chytriomyces hyalinus]|nr:hypothetical protein HDU80_008494 [Chytriomyces hyalinus]